MKQQKYDAKTYESSVLDELLSLITPEELARTESRMMLAAKIADAMAARKISKKQFAELVGQSPSVITKWLSGGHNFTVDTLTDIQRVLNVRLLALEEKPAPETIYKTIILGQSTNSREVPHPILGSSYAMIPEINKALVKPMDHFERAVAFA
jgi:transcriptional regulator with XRE-family HTH domain